DNKTYNKKYNCSHSSSNSRNCFLQNFTIFGSSTIPTAFTVPASSSVTVFENFTCNHNKTLIQFVYSATSAAPVTLTVSSFNSRNPVLLTLTPGDARTILLEDVQNVVFSNPSPTAATFDSLFIQQTTCICCND
ncbi:hypothetical protein, partial [Bacillus cereus]|uniref:hypothetical protein n=1 Tax=Bacillus cereus TaxID=1396 RepID=UPI0009E1A356